VKVSIPGLGGSLGECIYCGESFAYEIMTNRTVSIIHMEAFGDANLPIHDKCREDMQKLVDAGSEWTALPEGPLRQSYASVMGGIPDNGNQPTATAG
jgi:hypothetical protein